MVRAARYAYLALAWAFLVGLVAQVFFIGLGLFGPSDWTEVHVGFGWLLHLVPILILVAAALARAGRRRIQLAAALAAVTFVIPIVVLFKADAPFLAALHPVGALLAFWLGAIVARDARELSASPSADVAVERA
ncbi:MAG TPA: DUF6220 domain-containing protein [Candidatus Binatia bacterium]|nr:DUF6220 domain-containing protein [Candidatus Binatia bacterium]